MKTMNKILAILMSIVICMTLTTTVFAMGFEEFEEPYDFETETFYREVNEKWVVTSKTTKEFDDKGNNTATFYYDVTETGKEEPYSKDTYKYNDKNEVIEYSLYYYQDNEYKIQNTIEYTYSEGKVTEEVKYTYTEGKQIDSRYQYTYNNGLLIKLQNDEYNKGTSQYVEKYHNTYEYNAKGLCILEVQYQYSNLGEVTYVNKDVYEYDEQGREISHLCSMGHKVDFSDQANSMRTTMTYGEEYGRLKITELTYDIDGSNERLSGRCIMISADDVKSTYYENSFDGVTFNFVDHEKQLAYYDLITGKLIKIERYEIDKDGIETCDGYSEFTYKAVEETQETQTEEVKNDKKEERKADTQKKSHVGLVICIVLGSIVLLSVGSYVAWMLEIKKKGQDAQRTFKFLDNICSKISISKK